MTESLPPEDPRDGLIREQAGQIEALTALVAELRGQLDAALRAAARNSGNSSMPPSADDLPGRRPPARKERRAAELDAGQALGFLREVDSINLRRRTRAVDLAADLVGGDLADVPVCVLGAAFKPGSDDVRDSPALDVAQILHGMGAQVIVYDPAALANARRIYPELSYATTLAELHRTHTSFLC